jgi:hypothetical protein
MVMKMVAAIKKEFAIVIPLKVIFKLQTVFEMANFMEWENGSGEAEAFDNEASELIII